MWKGLLKVILAIVHGLEVSVANSCIGGVASAFHALEIAHTHYWTRESVADDRMSSVVGVTPSSVRNQFYPFVCNC